MDTAQYNNFTYHKDPSAETVRLGKIIQKSDDGLESISSVQFLHYAPADIIRLLDKGATIGDIIRSLKNEGS